MPTTDTRGLLWEMVAPLVRWPLRSPWRLVAVITVLVVVVMTLTRLGGDDSKTAATDTQTTSQPGQTGQSGQATADPTGSSPAATESEATATAAATETYSGSDEEHTAPPSTRETISDLASRFTGIYVDERMPRREWLRQLEEVTTEGLRALLGNVAQENVPGDRVGEVEILGAGEFGAQARVSTDAGAYVITMAYDGRQWLVSEVAPPRGGGQGR